MSEWTIGYHAMQDPRPGVGDSRARTDSRQGIFSCWTMLDYITYAPTLVMLSACGLYQ